jgi:hypothetical protein
MEVFFMIFRIPEEREFRLLVDGLYYEPTNQFLPFSLEIDCKLLNRYSFSVHYPYFDYSVSFRVIDLMENFIQMSYDHYDFARNIWQFSYHNILGSQAGSCNTNYHLFVQISWLEERGDNNQYILVSEVCVWVEFQDPSGGCGTFF